MAEAPWERLAGVMVLIHAIFLSLFKVVGKANAYCVWIRFSD